VKPDPGTRPEGPAVEAKGLGRTDRGGPAVFVETELRARDETDPEQLRPGGQPPSEHDAPRMEEHHRPRPEQETVPLHGLRRNRRAKAAVRVELHLAVGRAGDAPDPRPGGHATAPEPSFRVEPDHASRRETDALEFRRRSEPETSKPAGGPVEDPLPGRKGVGSALLHHLGFFPGSPPPGLQRFSFADGRR